MNSGAPAKDFLETTTKSKEDTKPKNNDCVRANVCLESEGEGGHDSSGPSLFFEPSWLCKPPRQSAFPCLSCARAFPNSLVVQFPSLLRFSESLSDTET